MKKAILIDALNKQVREVTLPDGLQGWYNAIGCDLVTVAFHISDRDSVLVDDEGLLKEPMHFFLYDGYLQPLAGNGLVVGCDEEGHTIDHSTTTQAIADKVTFMSRQEVIDYIRSGAAN